MRRATLSNKKRDDGRRAMCASAMSLWLAAWGVLCADAAAEDAAATLPDGVRAVWDLPAAYRESTTTRERVCINGLWQWQPARDAADALPRTGWGYFKVPGCWPGITDYMQKDCQTVYPHSSWQRLRLADITAAWYQREITIPAEWGGRRIVLHAEYVSSFATVLVDGQQVGELRYPAGEVDLTAVCRPGARHVLSLWVVAMPLKGVMLSYGDTASARQIKGEVARRGLCGDVYLASMPAGPRIRDVQVVTSVRQWSISVDTALEGLADNTKYVLQVRVAVGPDTVREFQSEPVEKSQLQNGRVTIAEGWKPEKLWDVHTPQNMYDLQVTLCDANGKALDAGLPARFGFREFWIEGRDFYLNGTRIFLSSVPLDNAQVGAAWATYDGARESMRRLGSFGINFVYTHNYGCEPGTHLSFEEILRAADDVGMLVALSQPHFGHYDWDSADAEQTNGYAQHAAFYVRVAQNHPSVVAYATSHNATGYGEDMNPDMIDGSQDRRSEWSLRNVRRAVQAEAIIKRLDSSRIVYHHSSGNLGSMHTSNFYANFAPVQEMSDWFEHWSTKGVKPLFTCEYSVPMPWDWTMYRGWYQGKREFGSATVPWEFCVAEWNAQFFGARAYQISNEEQENLRWEAKRFQEGRLWHRWDYPHQVGSSDFAERYPVYAQYFADNWPAFRTWEVSANSPWNHAHYWTLRAGVDKGRQRLPVDWQQLQRPGFSPDYIESRYESMDLSFERSDWIPTVAAETLMRNNRPLLAYIAGKPSALTSKDHIFYPGQSVEKQLIVINNSRETVQCTCEWSFDLPDKRSGTRDITVPTGQQDRTPLQFALPDRLAPGRYELSASARFSTGETQRDTFVVDVLPLPAEAAAPARIALFDPRGETRGLLDVLQIPYREIAADVDVAESEILVVGKNALTVAGAAPNVSRVRDGLKVVVFEQTPDVLEKRLGFRVAAYGLRQVFRRVPDHPLLAGLDAQHLRDWRGEATILPARLEYLATSHFSDAPTVRWCGIPVSRVWRCGNRGNVASVSIEKPARGDFLPILDGGYGLQFSPLIEYREGLGMILFCQMDVTGRTESDPAAEILARNVLAHAVAWKPSPQRAAAYVGDTTWKNHLESAGISVSAFRGDKPAVGDVLVVGPGGGRQLAEHAASIQQWLEVGGHVLALGLDQEEANAFLPMKVGMNRAEHIAAYFEPFGANSLLAGISPADIHSPAPQELPLVTSNVQVVGDGILGLANRARVVFCQLPPDCVDPALGKLGADRHNLKRTYRHTCFLVTRLLGNMGVASSTPLLTRFSAPVAESLGAAVVRNGDFGTDRDADGTADEWLFSSSVNEAACKREHVTESGEAWSLALSCPRPQVADDKNPPSTMLAQHDVPVQQGQWYRIAFEARAERLARNTVNMTITNIANWQALFDYQRFEPGPEWQRFSFEVQASDTVEQGTRFQIWFSGPGQLWLADVHIAAIPDPAQGRWLDGLYLDVPIEWDDPYRFFRW
jgi:hypothetical protein